MADGLMVWFVVWSVDGLCVLLNHWFDKSSRFMSYTLPYTLASLGTLSPLLTDDTVFRAVLSLASVFYFIKVREVLTEPRFKQEPLLNKFCSVGITFFDLSDRTLATDPTRMSRLATHLGWLAVHVGCQFACLHLFALRYDLFPSSSVAMRTQFSCTVLCLYFFFGLHVFSSALRANLVVVMPEYNFPSLMDSPQHSVTVRDFWKRWNLVVQSLLFKYVYKSARVRSGQQTATALTFLASGLVHVWPILAASLSNWPAAMEMFAYFVYQFLVIGVEGKMLETSKLVQKIKHEHPRIAQAWTILHLFGPSYLLIHPGLVLAEMEF